MLSNKYIKTKQQLWAKRNNISVVGSRITSGVRNYTKNFDENFFDTLTEKTKECFEKGDGNELHSSGIHLPKMQALHSSSSIAVNFFQYWENKKSYHEITHALGLTNAGNRYSNKIVFEKKFVIDNKFSIPPNIDVVIENDSSLNGLQFAIECKFTEAYSSRHHNGIDEKYFNLVDIWNGIPHLKEYALKINISDELNQYLHAAQLIKHILGLRKKYKNKFMLLYLFYDTIGNVSKIHRDEIEWFKKVCEQDKISFKSISYQEVIINLFKHYYSGNEEYINYLSDRYL